MPVREGYWSDLFVLGLAQAKKVSTGWPARRAGTGRVPARPLLPEYGTGQEGKHRRAGAGLILVRPNCHVLHDKILPHLRLNMHKDLLLPLILNQQFQ
jgi:hypothetical protein